MKNVKTKKTPRLKKTITLLSQIAIVEIETSLIKLQVDFLRKILIHIEEVSKASFLIPWQ